MPALVRKHLFLILFLGLIPFSCVRAKYPYYEIRQMIIEALTDHRFTIKTNDTLTDDSLIIKLNIYTEFLSQNPGWSFTTPALAFKKAENGSSGFKKDDIASMDFISDSEFNGVPAGQSLNSFFVRLQPGGQTESVNSAIGDLNASAPAPYPEKYAQFTYFLTSRPPGVSTHLFTLVTVFQSGKTHTTAAKVKWK